MRVLITGAAGFIGQRLARGLADEHTLRLADVAAPWPLDVTQPASVTAAMEGMEAVVHLAIASGREGDEEDEAFNQLRFDVNVKGTWNVLEAAARAKVSRVVLTSSLMVVWGYPAPQFVAADAPARPVGTYAMTKYLGEQMGEYFAREHRLSVVCLRIAKPIDLSDERTRQQPIRPQWVAFPDLVEAYRLALRAAGIGFEIVTIVGESSRRRWDLSMAERLLGYRPRYRLEEMGYVLGDERAKASQDERGT